MRKNLKENSISKNNELGKQLKKCFGMLIPICDEVEAAFVDLLNIRLIVVSTNCYDYYERREVVTC